MPPGRIRRHLFCSLILSGLAPGVRAQDVPAIPDFTPINPVTQNRSGLFAPTPVPGGTGWRVSTAFDYGSLIEYNLGNFGAYLLDAEVGRVTLSAGKDLAPKYFVLVGVSLVNAQAGFMDGFINWYHNLLGIEVPERAERPRNAFSYRLDLPDGISRLREPGMTVGDFRVSVGRRHNARFQSMVTATVPTGSGGDGYARGVPSLSTITTVLAPIGKRANYQGSLGLGYTPSHGDLERYQQELFGSASSGVVLRIWGHQALFAQLFWHSPYYHDTNYRALDRHELELNYGWLLRAGGRTWKIGMTEDISPAGPAVDAVFEFGLSWE
jgi:hypothetical protein